jgi:hypothetical protein
MTRSLHDWLIEEREYARQEQRRGRRYAFEVLDPGRTALVVIDMVPFFVSGSRYCLGIVPNIASLAGALRKAGGTVADANAARRDQDHNAALYTIYRTFGDVRPTGGQATSNVVPMPMPVIHSGTGS